MKQHVLQQYQCRACNRWFSEKISDNLTIEMVEPIFNWREWSKACKDIQKLEQKASYDIFTAKAKLDSGDIIAFLGDFHLGNVETDFLFFEKLTDYLLKHKIKFILLGDENDSFYANFYNALPVHQQILSPDNQIRFLRDWLDEVSHLLIATTWSNHNETRLEKLVGLKIYQEMKSKVAVYFNGIGRLEIKVKDIDYVWGLTHRPKGRSKWNPLHGAFNIAREEITDADGIAVAHYHEPAIAKWRIGQRRVTCVMPGCLKTKDEYTNRYFKFGEAQKVFPCVYFDDKKKNLIPFDTIEDGLIYKRGVKCSQN